MYLLRRLRRNVWFSVSVIVPLAVCLGVVTSVLAVVDWLFLRPPHGIVEPGQLGRVRLDVFDPTTQSGYSRDVLSFPEYQATKERAGSLLGLALYSSSAPTHATRGEQSLAVRKSLVSESYFRVLGVRPHRGAFFEGTHDVHPGESPVVVVSEDLARRIDPAIDRVPGQVLRISGLDYVIAGITPPGFVGVEPNATDVWVPTSVGGPAAFGGDWASNAGIYPFRMVARRRADVSPAIATQLLLTGVQQGSPSQAGLQYLSATLGPLQAERGSDRSASANLVLWLAGMSGLLLSVAGINLASMYLARVRRRSREMTVELALGASHWRLARHVLLEAVALTTVGAALGLLLAYWAADVLRTTVLPRSASAASVVDLRIAALAVVIALLVAAATAVVPALRSASLSPAWCAREIPQSTTQWGRVGRLVLHGAQASLCMALLVTTGLFLKSFWQASRLPLGFDPAGLYAVTSDAPREAISAEALASALDRLGERVGAMHGVAGVSLAADAPFASSTTALVYADGPGGQAISSLEGPYVNAVDGDYTRVLGSRLVEGRGIQPGETEPVAVINASAARRLWPGERAVGKCLRLFDEANSCTVVVGVSDDVTRMSVTDGAALQVWIPARTAPPAMRPRTLLIRAREGGDASQSLFATASQVLPREAQPRIRSIAQVVESQSAVWRNGATLFTLLAAVTILLAALGLYSSVSYVTTERYYDFGVRLAMGARPHQIALWYVGFGAAVTAIGAIGGMLIIRTAASWLGPILFSTPVFDFATIAGAGVVLATAVLAAIVRPAWIAARTDPSVLLRRVA